MRHLSIPTLACVLIAAAFLSCGGSWVVGPLLRPPSIREDAARRIAETAPVPDDEWPKAQPVAVRVYATGEIVVDVLVMMSAVEPRWSTNPGRPVPDSRAVSVAGFHTNGFNVPAEQHSGGQEGSAILIRTADGREFKPVRAVLGAPPFETNREELRASANWLENIPVIQVTRAGKPYQACFVPVLLSGDGTLRAGDDVDIRIKPPHDKERYDIDDRWYRLEVGAMEPAASSGG